MTDRVPAPVPEPHTPELEDDETVPPRPEEEAADTVRARPDFAAHDEHH